MIRPEAEHVTGWGFTRRVASVEGGLVGITRDRFVFRADRDGTPRWRLRLPDLLHTVAVSPDGTRALVATNGGAVELDTADGSRRASLGVDGLPVWATAYLQDGARVLITRNGVIAVLDPEGPRVRWRFDQGEYPKRAWTQDGRLYVVGDGGLKEIEVGVGVAARWSKLLSNTVENAVVSDGLVVASSYGMQLASYDHAGVTFAGLLEDLPDYPKALAVVRDAQDAPTCWWAAAPGCSRSTAWTPAPGVAADAPCSPNCATTGCPATGSASPWSTGTPGTPSPPARRLTSRATRPEPHAPRTRRDTSCAPSTCGPAPTAMRHPSPTWPSGRTAHGSRPPPTTAPCSCGTYGIRRRPRR